MMRKQTFLSKIAPLDAQKDHLAISHWVAYHDFPWDSTRALEFALFRTFAVPSIGKLLLGTHEFSERTQKRYDDTDLILSEIIEYGYESARGKAALARMNQMHGRFNIANDDFKYVLSTFVIEPYRWNQRFGYRISTQKELIAGYTLWAEIGKRMGIQDIPPSFEAMEQFNIQYEQTQFGYTEAGRKVADATLHLMLGWYLPRFLFPVAKPFAYAMMDERLRQAMHYPSPNWLVRASLYSAMQLRKWMLACVPLRRKPKFRTKRRVKSYPDGYAVGELGVK
jgi:hypothetical protein